MNKETFNKAIDLNNKIAHCQSEISYWESADCANVINTDKEGLNANPHYVAGDDFKELSGFVVKMYKEKIEALETEFKNL